MVETLKMSEQPLLNRGRRAQGRLRLFLQARINFRDRHCRALLCDLSTDGAMVMTATELPVGYQAIIRWGRFEAFGEVRWVDGQIAGISFIDPIAWETVLDTRQQQEAEGLSAKAAEHWITDHSWGIAKALM